MNVHRGNRSIVIVFFLFVFTGKVYSYLGGVAWPFIHPHGARTSGMGETGVGLADDESALAFNVAGLGIKNARWDGGAVRFAYDPFFPTLRLEKLWHATATAFYQHETLGGFGVDYHHFNRDFSYSDNHNVLYYEYAISVGWGFHLKDYNSKNQYFGIAAKLLKSDLMSDIRDREVRAPVSVACDVGYIWQCMEPLRMGCSLVNMGTNLVYASDIPEEPLPFALKLGLGYKDFLGHILHGNKGDSLVFVSMGLDFERKFIKYDKDGNPDPFWKALFTSITDEPFKDELKQTSVKTEGEIVFRKTFSLRSGFLFDWINERYELRLGTGLHLLDHYSLDAYYLHSPEGFFKKFCQSINENKTGASGLYNGQWGVTLTVTNVSPY